jgi:formylglycine-generating enzyme required for sulfatase activity
VYIPATGAEGFAMGMEGRPGDGKPSSQRRVVLTQPFCIDATEVTVAAYERCVNAGSCEAPRIWGLWINYPKLADHPVNKVHFNHAKTYCEARGQSLPTEAQWEWAATGGDGRKWAWGNDTPTCAHADFTPGNLDTPASDDGCNGGGTSPVKSFPRGDKIWPAGRVHDLTGNVWEWCLDNYLPLPNTPETDPLHAKYPNGVHVVRGGGWNRSHRGIQNQFRGGAVVDYQVPALGLRCVRNATASSNNSQ